MQGNAGKVRPASITFTIFDVEQFQLHKSHSGWNYVTKYLLSASTKMVSCASKAAFGSQITSGFCWPLRVSSVFRQDELSLLTRSLLTCNLTPQTGHPMVSGRRQPRSVLVGLIARSGIPGMTWESLKFPPLNLSEGWMWLWKRGSSHARALSL